MKAGKKEEENTMTGESSKKGEQETVSLDEEVAKEHLSDEEDAPVQEVAIPKPSDEQIVHDYQLYRRVGGKAVPEYERLVEKVETEKEAEPHAETV